MGRPRTKPQPYTVDTVCKCGCGNIFKNPDDHFRYRTYIDGHYDNTGDKHPRFGKKETFEHLERRVESIKNTLKSKPPTCLEIDLFSFLNQKGLQYIKQVRMGTAIVDAYVPELKLCLFADGEYWHNKPGAKEKDLRQIKMLEDNGYNVIRLKSINYGYNLNFTPLINYLNMA